MDIASEPFRTGDIVRLVGGGPPMTVQIASRFLAYCVWFAGDDLRTGAFPPASLVRTRLGSDERVPDAIRAGWTAAPPPRSSD
jgi:uncharacterized protein YodC (DUF2158 family)